MVPCDFAAWLLLLFCMLMVESSTWAETPQARNAATAVTTIRERTVGGNNILELSIDSATYFTMMKFIRMSIHPHYKTNRSMGQKPLQRNFKLQ
jgi:hypothetical protein